MDEQFRVEFDASVDDVADSGRRYLRATEAGRVLTRKDVLWATLISTAAFFVAVMWIAERRSWTSAAVAATIAALWGLLFYWGYRRLNDMYVFRRLRAFAKEELGRRDVFHCIAELRENGAWMATNGTEVTLPWTESTAVRDTSGGIELHFRGGLMLVRDRAFENPSDRAAFLRRARELARMPG